MRIAAIVTIALLAAVFARAETRTIEIVAGKDNVFHLPAEEKILHLKSGEKIHFKISSYFGGEKGRDGSVHSLVVKSLRDEGWDVRLKPGVQEFDLTAPKPGEYLVECTVKCGPGHDTMSFKMVVQ